MNMTLPRSQLASLLVLIAACDTRADEHYPGDSLLHLEGRVTLEDHDGQGLVPALAFATKRGMEIVEVDVQGSFPNNFRIEVYSPPPEAARLSARDDLGLPRGVQLAVGYIAAIPKNHPKQLLYGHYHSVEMLPSALVGCATATPACQRIERWCVDSTERECRVFTFPCEEKETCEPTMVEGNPAIIDQPSDALAGLSEKIVIMWTRDGLPASSIFSHSLGIDQDLKPGYNLVELGEERPALESDSSIDCASCTSDGVCTNCDGTQYTIGPDGCRNPARDPPIQVEALARYNAAHGTHYACTDAAYAALDPSGTNLAAQDAFSDEVSFYADQIRIEQGVDISELEGTRVIADWNTPLVIKVSPDIDPLI